VVCESWQLLLLVNTLLVSINKVAPEWVRLVLGWVTVCRQVNHLGKKPATKINQLRLPSVFCVSSVSKSICNSSSSSSGSGSSSSSSLTLPYLWGGRRTRQHPALRPPGGPIAHLVAVATVAEVVEGWVTVIVRLLANTVTSEHSYQRWQRDWPRDQCVTVAQVRTGHSPLVAAYLHRIGRRDSAICPHCHSADEAVEHLVFQCPAHDHARRDTWPGDTFTTASGATWNGLGQWPPPRPGMRQRERESRSSSCTRTLLMSQSFQKKIKSSWWNWMRLHEPGRYVCTRGLFRRRVRPFRMNAKSYDHTTNTTQTGFNVSQWSTESRNHKRH